jgi:ATP-binding cassette subfamily B protein
VIPVDHLLLPEAKAFPAILVVRLPNGFTHFLVAWRRHGPLVQLMDPSRGRRFTTGKRLLEETYVHTLALPASTFRDWVVSEDFLAPFRARLRRLGCETSCRAALEAALADDGWRSMAILDAAVRMTDAVVRGGGLAKGEEASRTIAALCRGAHEGRSVIPDAYYTARPAPADASEGGEELVIARGAVLVRVRSGRPAREPQSPELRLALAEKPVRPGAHLLSMLREDGIWNLPLLSLSLIGAVVATAFEAVLLRSLFDVGRLLGLFRERLVAMAALVAFAACLLAIELPIAKTVLRLGRHLETRLRVAFLGKIPRLGDRYFQSRPISDMAERSHAIHEVRGLPDFGAQVVRTGADLLVTTAAIAWLDRASAPWAIATAIGAVAVPMLAQPIVVERTLRAQSHLGATARFYLDALLGLLPVRTHGAERAVRREHEALLVEWARSAEAVVRALVATEAVQGVVAYAFTVPLILAYVGRASEPAAVLLLIYWALALPALGQDLSVALRQYPEQRNRVLRLLEPLGAADGEVAASAAPEPPPERRTGVAIGFEAVGVVAAGHTILRDLDLQIEAGTHVAVVGASGAGKSSMLGLLLGWHRPASGQILVDGVPLDAARRAALRGETAWVDPAVHLWNRSLLENAQYGTEGRGAPFESILEAADLYELLRKLPDGLQTPLGEGGALVSGGEGQRVRLARALGRRDARLVLLDEPFRGLDRASRHELIGRACTWWSQATMLCVTHDIDETRSFDRVIVIDEGRIVEAGAPAELAAEEGSRYAAMLREEEELRDVTWGDATWRRLRMDKGILSA